MTEWRPLQAATCRTLGKDADALVDVLAENFNYRPVTGVDEGAWRFTQWRRGDYKA